MSEPGEDPPSTPTLPDVEPEPKTESESSSVTTENQTETKKLNPIHLRRPKK